MKRTFLRLANLIRAIQRGAAPLRAMLFGAFLAATAAAQTPPPLVSPEVHSDHRVTFRFRGPNVKEVLVFVDGTPKPLPMQQDDQGVWSATTDPLAPDYYNYSFSVEGLNSFDPSNYATVPNFLYRESSVHVPGPPTLSWETNDVPRGEVHHHFYKSGVVGDDRGFFVYTPPGYDPRGKQSYPVLYLLHGFSGDANAWTAVARAIAGLSMGGSESLMTGLNTLNQFAWIGAFSSGGITEEFDKEFPALDAKGAPQPRLLWIACGTDDRLIEINRKFRAWLASKKIQHADIETPGGHTWMVWRRNLTEFSSLLFR